MHDGSVRKADGRNNSGVGAGCVTRDYSGYNVQQQKGLSMRKRLGRVYLVTNVVNQKRYIGFTVKTIDARWRVHVRGKSCAAKTLSADVAKYGVEKFRLELLYERSVQSCSKKRSFLYS